MKLNVVLLALVASVAASPAGNLFERKTCDAADRCIKALKNTAHPGKADCNSYLRATVTPATHTSYTTKTFSTTPTVTYKVTGTVTKLVTATQVVKQTSTKTVTKQVTVTAAAQTIKKRQVTKTPTKIPSYASVCSGRARYTSACSCIGAKAKTTTLARPTKVITVSKTVTPTKATRYITVNTKQVTRTAATVTKTTVVAIKTVTKDVPVATITPAARFYVRVNNEQVRGQYLRVGGSESRAKDWLQTNAQKHQVDSVFTLAENGNLLSGGRALYYDVTSVNSPAVFSIIAGPPRSGSRPINCCTDEATKRLYCQNPAEPGADLVSCTNNSVPAASWYNGAGNLQSECRRLELTFELV